MEEFTKLQKILSQAQNEVGILKKEVGKGLIGGPSHIKIKEADSYN